MRSTMIAACVTVVSSIAWAGAPQYDANPFVIPLSVQAPKESPGGIVTADLDNDGQMDYIVTVPGRIAAYAHDGKELWAHDASIRVGGSSESEGLPGHHGPGVQAVDIDGDGRTDVLGLTNDSVLHVLDGATGEHKWQAKPPNPQGSDRWEHAVVANFRGQGDRDLLLQATNNDGYRMGRYIAAYSLDALREGTLEPLWQRDDFLACAHNGARVADLDGDGRDEVLGGTIIGPDGNLRYSLPVRGHIDSIFVYDVRPDIPGLEIVALEEGGKDGNRVFLYNGERLIWETHYEHWEPQNAAVGEFDPDRPGLEIWCRSRFNEHQKPFVFDAQGELISRYDMDDVAPEGWTVRGVEVIWCIDWTGGPRQLAAAKERHTDGDIAVFDPISGKFLAQFDDEAARFFVADVSGDWREEMIVFSGNTLRIYHNPEPNPQPDRPRPWQRPEYRRSKMTYNYYSP